MCSLFQGCSSLSSLYEISDWSLINVIDMRYMFSECSNLSSLDGISKWDIDKVQKKENIDSRR